jgi:hypothetical protein
MSARAIITRCALAAREQVRLHVAALAQAELLEEVVRSHGRLGPADAVVGGVEDEVLADRDRAVEVAALWHDREPAARPYRIPDDVDATDRRPAAVGPDARGEHPTVVVLPAPFGPKRPNTSPASTVKEIPSTAFVRPFG